MAWQQRKRCTAALPSNHEEHWERATIGSALPLALPLVAESDRTASKPASKPAEHDKQKWTTLKTKAATRENVWPYQIAEAGLEPATTGL